MHCVICRHGQTEPGTTTVTLERDHATVAVRDVPARVCDKCGEAYLDEGVSQRLLDEAESAVTNGTELEIHHFEAA